MPRPLRYRWLLTCHGDFILEKQEEMVVKVMSNDLHELFSGLYNNPILLLLLLLSHSSRVLLCGPHRQQPTRLPHPRDSQGKSTGAGCHFLLQCMKVKSESEVAQLCLTLSDPMDSSVPGSSVHGIFQARVLEWVAIAFSWELWVKLYELSFIWGEIRTAAQQAAYQIALRDCSKAAVGERQYIMFWWRGSSIPWSTHFTKGFLLVTRIWCHHEGI